MTQGWIIPPQTDPRKSCDEFRQEREKKVRQLIADGLLHSDGIRSALLAVPREEFIPRRYRDYAYQEVPLPLPGSRATISCPHSYPLFYEPLGLDVGHRFLEIGLGSGYGAAVAREVVGPTGLVVSIEIDPVTYEFGRANLERAGYHDVRVVLGDGGLGYQADAPYDRICITAACEKIPSPLLEQLKAGGKLIAPIEERGVQNLTLLTKGEQGLNRQVICEVLYVPLRGRYGQVPSVSS
ncbi:MAG TPA: protein-L-isoaspartate O-methyltransferase [Nitrospira sp.]|nr:protein-L-isoaspartate O-methyltransferase [Nitrospira sp.]